MRWIARMWASGLTIREIADVVGATPNSISVTIVRMRRLGWDMPYRYRQGDVVDSVGFMTHDREAR